MWKLGLAGLLCAGALLGCRTTQPQPAEVDPFTAVNTIFPAPDDFARQRIGTAEYPIPPQAKFLQGARICLDPGHGGEAQRREWKRGPTGVREAEVNLRVALYLRDLLEAAGAEVLMTRTDDSLVANGARPKMANEWGADIFLSIHHNAVNKPHVNYTTVWYHADESARPSNLDLARYLCMELFDSLQLPQTTDVPLKSDQLMYESGFGVLRGATMTAALSESSFHSNPEQEQRLRDPAYNLREAYALFRGLLHYATAGWPSIELHTPADGAITDVTAPLVVELHDGLRTRRAWGHERRMILPDTIAARIDDAAVPFEFTDDGKTYLLTLTLPADLAAGEHVVEVQFENVFKNSVLEPFVTVTVP